MANSSPAAADSILREEGDGRATATSLIGLRLMMAACSHKDELSPLFEGGQLLSDQQLGDVARRAVRAAHQQFDRQRLGLWDVSCRGTGKETKTHSERNQQRDVRSVCCRQWSSR